MGKCPKCERLLANCLVEDIDARAGARHWKGVQYLCPFCRTVLSVAIDPVALKADTVADLEKALRKPR